MTGNTLAKHTFKRGFSCMDLQRQREIASLGGKAARASGKAHEFNSFKPVKPAKPVARASALAAATPTQQAIHPRKVKRVADQP